MELRKIFSQELREVTFFLKQCNEMHWWFDILIIWHILMLIHRCKNVIKELTIRNYIVSKYNTLFIRCGSFWAQCTVGQGFSVSQDQ